MRKLGVALATIVCVTVLFISYSIWKDKLEAASGGNEASAAPPSESADTENTSESSKTEDDIGLTVTDLQQLTEAMDGPVRQMFYDRHGAGESVRLLILGSVAMDAGEPGYSELLTEAIESAYGEFVQVETMSFDGTSLAFMASGEEVPDADVLLLEPFTLNNNGEVLIETEHEHIRELLANMRTEVDDAVLVLHPPQPIYGARFYTRQVSALKEFASFYNYSYVDHWQAWPETSNIELKDFLTESDSPNSSGAEVWANELIAYFTAE